MTNNYSDYIKERIEESKENSGRLTSKTDDDASELVRKIFSKTDYEGFLSEAIKQGFLSSSDIIHASDIYSAPSEYDSEQEQCIEEIRAAFERIEDNNENVRLSELKMHHLPQVQEVMDIIKDYYDKDEILGIECFSEDDLMYQLENSWTLDSHDSDIREKCENEYLERLEEELDAIDFDFQRNFESKTPDELWETIANKGMCGYYDYDKIEKSLREFVQDVQKSNYNVNNKVKIL